MGCKSKSCVLLCTYEAVAAAFSRLPVGDHHRFQYFAERLEEVPQRLVGGVIRQAADEYLGEGRVLLMRHSAAVVLLPFG